MPLNLVGSLQAPKGADAETIGDEVEGFVSGLLGLVDIDADPLSSREHILLSNIVAASWSAGRDLDLATLVGQVQSPPIRKLGVFDLDTFFPPSDRTALALRLNGLLASPSFAAWAQGVPFDIDRLLKTDDGKPAAAIVTIAHLSDAERQFVVSLLLGKLVTWMRRQSGTTDLRALVYMDEVAGYAPPTAEPPSKKPILTLLKQARAFGVGLVLSTQNPVDLDYKAISNAGTWMVGRLQTEQDKKRLLDGMSAAGGGVDINALGDTISGLAKREFVLRRAGVDQPAVFTTRWAMAYLRGPLTREQIASLTPHDAPESLPPPAPGVAAANLPPPGEMAPPDNRRVAGRAEGRRQHPDPLPRPRHSLGVAGRRGAGRDAPRRRGGRAGEPPVRRRQGRAPTVRGVGGGALPVAGEPRPVRRDRGGLRRAQPRDRGATGRAVRAARGAGRHEDVLDLTAAKPRRPARAHPHDRDPAQRQAQALLTRRRDARAVRAAMRRGGRCRSPIRSSRRCETSTSPGTTRPAPRWPPRRTRSACTSRKRRPRGTTASSARSATCSAASWAAGAACGPMSRSISRSQGRASTANKRLDSAKNRADEKQDALADLEQEFEADLAEVHAEADAVAAAIDTMTVPLEKTDVKVVDIALVWVPQA